ncbi:hypothetical protein G6F46_015660 [Rhizopus delemar]|nr:hypothetical protein G6F31_020048 [Rhizopus arrhizus]KAG1579429.1 hypothetical protein G6F46_015660 [Rhizopus delemar]
MLFDGIQQSLPGQTARPAVKDPDNLRNIRITEVLCSTHDADPSTSTFHSISTEPSSRCVSDRRASFACCNRDAGLT